MDYEEYDRWASVLKSPPPSWNALDCARSEADVLNALWDFGKRICSPVVCHFATTYGSKP